MPVEEMMGHPVVYACSDPDFALNGEKPSRCLHANHALADMPLRNIKVLSRKKVTGPPYLRLPPAPGKILRSPRLPSCPPQRKSGVLFRAL